MSAVLTEGEPLSTERRFRLRGYTAATLACFLIGHIVVYAPIVRICGCSTYPVAYFDAGTVRVALLGSLFLLYGVGWIEVLRMLYVRWWPHWGTLAPKSNVFEAARTAFPVHLRVISILAVMTFLAVISCETFKPGHQPSSGWQAGVFTGILGGVGSAYMAWFVRVLEPFGSIPPSKPR